MPLPAPSGYLLLCASLALAPMTGCATGGAAGAGVGGGRSPTLLSAQPSGGPELVGTASLPLNVAGAAGPSAALATALVLNAFDWPVVSLDTVQGALVSDWQYFEPAVRGSAGEGFCQNPMALRFLVRAFDGRVAQIAAEAYVPRSGRSSGWSDSLEPTADPLRRQALTEARAALAALRSAVAATGGVQGAEERAMTDLGRQLDSGDFHRCADATR